MDAKGLSYEEYGKLCEELREVARKFGLRVVMAQQAKRPPRGAWDPAQQHYPKIIIYDHIGLLR